jgi:hypothetical protein
LRLFRDDTAPRWLLRDRDAIYGDVFRRRVASMGITEAITSPSSPWQNPYAERLIGSLRRECLDHVIVLSPAHLRRMIARYVSYYHGTRTHLPPSRTHPRHVASKRQRKVASWRSRRLVAFTFGTSDAQPDVTCHVPPGCNRSEHAISPPTHDRTRHLTSAIEFLTSAALEAVQSAQTDAESFLANHN